MSAAPRVKRFESSHSYGIVLGLVTLSLVFSLVVPDGVASRVVLTVVYGITLIVVVRTTEARPYVRNVVVVGVALSLLAALGAVLIGGDYSTAGVRLIGALLVALAPIVLGFGVVRQIRQDGQITVRSVAGVIAIYLLLGMLFAVVISAAQSLDPPYFRQEGDAPFEQILYFSFITLTTVGYGDLSPVAEFGRGLSVIEALLGQLYLVTVVGLLIGNVGRTTRQAVAEVAPGEAPGEPQTPSR